MSGFRKRRAPRVRPDACLNCGTPLEDQFCPHCGQNNRHHRLEMPELAESVLDHLLDLDAPLFRTVAGLTLRPGPMCLEYVRGRRRRYSNPIRYCVITAALYVFMLTVFELSPSAAVLSTAGQPAAPAATGAPAADDADHALDSASNPEVEKRARARRIRAYIRHEAARRVEQSLNVVVFFAVPFIALSLMLLFRRAQHTYAEHLAFAYFLYGHVFLIDTALLWTTRYGPMLLAANAVGLAYTTWAMVGFYRTRIMSTLLRALVASAVQIVTSTALGTVVVLIWIAYLFASGAIWERVP